jgi:hypothetical protein
MPEAQPEDKTAEGGEKQAEMPTASASTSVSADAVPEVHLEHADASAVAAQTASPSVTRHPRVQAPHGFFTNGMPYRPNDTKTNDSKKKS